MAIEHSASDAFRGELIGLIPQMRAFARSLCGDATAGDDLAQEALLKAWTANKSYMPGTNMKAWVFMIVRRRALGWTSFWLITTVWPRKRSMIERT